MKTGLCKFGLTCKFHHPKDIAITVAEVEKGNGGQMEAITAGTNGNMTLANPSFTPAMLHNSKGLPIRPVICLHIFYNIISFFILQQLICLVSVIINCFLLKQGEADCPFYLKTGRLIH